MTSDRTHARRWWTLGAVCIGLLIISIDNTIVNVALPTLTRELGATNSQLQWIVDAYVLAFAGLLLPAGALGDRFGRKGILLGGMAVFLAASIGAAAADDVTALIAARVVMGVGAALIMPATLSIIIDVFRIPAERSRAIALWAGVAGLGVAIGPVAGGWLLERYGWWSAFLVNVPVLILGIGAVVVTVPRSRHVDAPPLDAIGALLALAGLTTLVWGIIEAPSRGWASTATLATLAAAAVVLAAFLVHERRTRHPMLDLSFFADARFTAASVAVTLTSFALFGSMFLFTQLMQQVLGYSAFEAGFRLLPLAVTLLAAAGLSVQLVARFGTKLVVSGAMTTIAGGLLLAARIDQASTYGQIVIPLLVLAAGMGCTIAPATESIMGSLPEERAGVGSAVNDTARELGGALGVAVLGSLLASSYGPAMRDAVTGLPPEAATVGADSLGGALHVAQSIGPPDGLALATAAQSAFVDSMSSTMGIAAGVALAGAVVAALFLPARGRSPENREDEVDDATADVESQPAGSVAP